MRSYNDEDAEIHRAMARQRTQHQIELRRAEEQGYARGLKEAVGLILDKQMQED
ncbi:hypothetical protein QM013_29720 [Pseudomonas aeruginosa]|nr:hypothetical protein [Pseudomonas aeruginosa]MDS1044310.1 hypothetical protein [Pseudomonas aeruginosa]